MNEQEQQNEAQEEQNIQMELTSLSEPASHKKLIIGIVAVFVLVVAGGAGAYFFLQSQPESDEDKNVEVTDRIKVSGPLDGITFEEGQAVNDAIMELNMGEYFITDLIQEIYRELFINQEAPILPNLEEGESFHTYLMNEQNVLVGIVKLEIVSYWNWRPVNLLHEAGIDYSMDFSEPGIYKYLFVHFIKDAQRCGKPVGCAPDSFEGFEFTGENNLVREKRNYMSDTEVINAYKSDASFKISGVMSQ